MSKCDWDGKKRRMGGALYAISGESRKKDARGSVRWPARLTEVGHKKKKCSEILMQPWRHSLSAGNPVMAVGQVGPSLKGESGNNVFLVI